MTFSSLKRKQILEDSNDEHVDILVIGGGITGAGIALDAASRGMKVLVIEMQDFSAGTSSRSTKLVHGGLRYLKQLEVRHVAELGKERMFVHENGPHVTVPEWMLLPIYNGGTFGRFSTSVGLKIYDYLAGVKKSERRKMLSMSDTLIKEPLLRKDGLKGGGYYVEYRTDDTRLTIEVMKEAVRYGAKAVNYVKAEELLKKDDKVVGVQVRDELDGKLYHMYATRIINATGPWVDELREKDKSKIGKTLKLSKGIHLVFDQGRFPLKQATYFDTPDGRMVFAIPRSGKTYVGTTDTFYEEDLRYPKMTINDRKYMLDAINYIFPSLKIMERDVESSWAGIRPLINEVGKKASEISRKDEIWVSASGLITIAGGKLTGYRRMAEMVVDLAARLMTKEGYGAFPACRTKNMPISGGKVGGSDQFPVFIEETKKAGARYGLTTEQAEKLARMYGSNVNLLFDIIQIKGREAESSGLPIVIFAMLEYAIEEEMATKPVDFFIRRTGALYFDIQWVRVWKNSVIEYMSKRLNWSSVQKYEYKKELEAQLYDAVAPGDDLLMQ